MYQAVLLRRAIVARPAVQQHVSGVARRGLSAAAADASDKTEDSPKQQQQQQQAEPAATQQKKFRDSDKRWKAKKEALERKEKTALCPDFTSNGKCDNPKCRHAHGLSELRSPSYFQQAEAAAKQEQRPITADDLLDAKMNEIFRKASGYKEAIQGMQVETTCVSSVEWSQKKLDLVRLVEKASITIPLKSLVAAWNVSPVQTVLLKQVVGPRYDPDTDSFKLIKRNRKPFTEIVDEETVYDPLIQKLYLIVKEVKGVCSEPYTDAVSVPAVARHPRIAIEPVVGNSE